MIPSWIAAIEKRIEANGGKYIAGKSITIADFALSSVCFNFLMNETNPHYSETLTFIKDHAILNKYVNGLK
jgi:glutathione S-transferase